ncbi:MAG: pilus assembly protein [Planctomycetota bacterium]
MTPAPTNTDAGVRRDRRGATIVLIVVLSTFLIGLVAFAVDVSWMYVVRSQTQSAVDAGAIAAGLSLREYPEDVEQARLYAEHFVQLNAVGRQAVVPTDAITVETGTWLESSSDFRPGGADPKSVRVVADAANEPLAFGGIFNRTTFRVDREAVAVGGGTPMDIIMTLDLSGSMGSQGRIEALRAAAPTFVDVILGVSDDDRIGVMGYGALLGS